MSNYTTYNNVIEKLRLIANNHNQVNGFIVNHPLEVNDSNLTFPIFAIYPSNANIIKGKITMTFKFFVMDLLNQDYDNESEILSDTLQIANDIINYINDNEEDLGFYIIDEDVNFQPFAENFKVGEGEDISDDVAGWFAELQIVYRNNQNSCIAPINVTAPSSTPTTPPVVNNWYLSSTSNVYTINAINNNQVTYNSFNAPNIGGYVTLSDATNSYAKNFEIINVDLGVGPGEFLLTLDDTITGNFTHVSILTEATQIVENSQYGVYQTSIGDSDYSFVGNIISTAISMGDKIQLTDSNGNKKYDIVSQVNLDVFGTSIESIRGYLKIFDAIQLTKVTIS